MPISVTHYATFEEAGRALAASPRTQFLGGGTLVMRWVNEGDQSFSEIVRSSDHSAKRIEVRGDQIAIGASVTMAEILAHRDLAFLSPAARAVGGPAIRTMATVGGNLFAHHPYGDFTVALLALGCEVENSEGRTSPLETFLANRDQYGLVSGVSVKRPRDPKEFRFRKVTRVKPKGVSVMSIAALLPQSGGRISNSRVAYGAMAPTPVRVDAVERALEGKTLDEAGVANAISSAVDGLNPPTDPIATEWYRCEVAPVHLKRLLLEGGW